MNLRKHRYQHPEPGDTGGAGPAAPASAEPPALDAPAPADPPGVYAPLANNQDPAPAAKPADPDPAKPAAPAGKPAEQLENAAKIEALLDTIGKEPATPAAKPETKPASKAEEPAKPPVPAVDPKALDLTPPEGMAERAKTRWTELAERAKQVPDLERRATEAETALTGVRDLVAQSGLQADEFQGMLAMGKLYKSSDPKELQEALQQLDGLRADLAIRLGVDAPGVDALAAFPDLAKRVEDMSLSRVDALEIAKLRNGAEQFQAQNRNQQEFSQYQKTLKAAAAEMDATMTQRANTPGHAAKLEYIRGYFADQKRLNEFVTTYQPNQWKAAVLMMYDSYAPPAAPALPNTPQPLRPGHVASGVRQPGNKPVSSADAVENAWAALGM